MRRVVEPPAVVLQTGVGMTDLPSGWSPRHYRDDDIEGLLQLQRDSLGEWPGREITVSPIEHLRWKLASHELARRYSTVAELDSRIVGSMLLIVRRVKVGERLLVARYGADMVVHPDYRGRGILAAMWGVRELGRDAFDLNLGQGGHPAARRLGRDARRTEFANQTDILVRSLDGVRARAAAGPTAWTVRGVPNFDERVNDFWAEAARPFEFIGVRDLEYLTWRYDARGGRFIIRLAEQGERLLGYVVLGTSHGAGFVADLLALPGRLDVVESLVRDAIERLRELGASDVACAVPRHHPYRLVLREHGFRAKRRSIPLNYRPKRSQDRELAFLSDPKATLHVSLGDTDRV